MPEKKCKRCGIEYRVPPYRADKTKYCSDECKKVKLVPKECAYCGAGFFVSPYRQDTAKYCCRNCWISSMKKKKEERESSLPESRKKKCLSCDKVFFVPKHREKTAKYCSRDCTKKTKQKKVCLVCKKEYEVYPYVDNSSYCSKECKCKHQTIEGYTIKTCRNCGRSFYLTKSKSKHQKYCSRKCTGEQAKNQIILICLVCNHPFSTPLSKKHIAKYCCNDCRNKAKRKVKNRPPKKQLEHLLCCQTIKETAAMYDVSSSTVRYWIEAEEVEYKWCKEMLKQKKKLSKEYTKRLKGKNGRPRKEKGKESLCK